MVKKAARNEFLSTGTDDGPGGPFGAPSAEHLYNLTFSVRVQNLLNRTNAGVPIRNLSSPLRFQSNTSAGGFDFGPGGGINAGDRRVKLQMRFSF